MKRLEFHISYICNHNCIFCSESERISKFKQNPLSLLQIKTILVDRRKKGFDHINFTGGEPTIVPGFLDLLKFTKKLGYKIYVGTNGDTLYSDSFTNESLKHIDELSLSIHWYNKQTCITQTGNIMHFKNFKKIVENINKFKGNNILFVNIVINKFNYKDVVKILYFIVRAGYNFQQALISYIAPEGKGNKDYGNLSFDLNDFKNYIPKIIEFGKINNKIIRFFGVPICILGDKLAQYSNDIHWEDRYTIERGINKNGKVSLVEIYNKDNSRERIFINKCVSCKWKKKPCTGVFQKYLNFYSI